MRPISDASKLSFEPSLPDDYFGQLLRLSILASKVGSMIYGPDGVKHASNAEIVQLRDDLVKWRTNLAGHLVFTGVWSTLPAGAYDSFDSV
jgi:hypothetical protein